VELLPPRRQNLSGKRKFFPFFYCTFPKTCPPNRSNPQDLGAGEQEFRGAELKKSLCMIPLSDACGATSPGGRGFVGIFGFAAKHRATPGGMSADEIMCSCP